MPVTALGVIAGAVLVKSQAEWVNVFTLLASLRTGLVSFLRPNECAVMLPDSFWLFGRMSVFREIELLEADQMGEFAERLKRLVSTCNELKQKSRSIPRDVCVAARKGIEEGEVTHKVDKEK